MLIDYLLFRDLETESPRGYDAMHLGGTTCLTLLV